MNDSKDVIWAAILKELEESNRLLTAILAQKLPVHPDVEDMLFWRPENEQED